MKNRKQELGKKWKEVFPNNVSKGWRNFVENWYIENATPGLYTLDIEHIPDELVSKHNDPASGENIASRYRVDLCPHKCPFCFNEDSDIYGLEKGSGEKKRRNKVMTLEDTFRVIDEAKKIASTEGHDFRNVKFLGPGELLLNTQLFQILDGYKLRDVGIGIFTKGAVLGDDTLAQKHHGMTAKELTDKLAGYDNVSLIFSFQSFDYDLQDSLVTSKSDNGIIGLQGYSKIRERAIDNLFGSSFYKNGTTHRVAMINAPIIPENIGESFDIYEFFIKRGTPVIMTPSMVSGKGCGQLERQTKQININEWFSKLVELYAKVYDFNVRMRIQTEEEIKREGISCYTGNSPCNQASTGMYVRANGYVQMCPGRFDKETFFGDLEDASLREIWNKSPNKKRGISNPHNLVNNRCPAKDGYAFPEGFYDKVMDKYLELRRLNDARTN